MYKGEIANTQLLLYDRRINNIYVRSIYSKGNQLLFKFI